MKRFKNALNYYKDLDLEVPRIQEKYITALLYTTDITSDIERKAFLETLKEKNFDEQVLFYYATSLSCLEDFHQCKITFGEYFDTKVEVTP